MVDDLGWNGFSLQGNNNEVKNPTMEKLAQDAVLLENYYVYKFCSPSRAAFLTGRVPGHGIWEINPGNAAEVGVNLKATMISAMLKNRAGYSTHQIGKWHQGFYAPEYTPRGRGFDTSFGFLMGGADHFNQCRACANSIAPPDYTNHSQTCSVKDSCNVTCPEQGGVDLYRDDGPAFGENGTAYSSYLWSREAERIIDANHGSIPMFMYLALHNVHQPVEAPPEFLNHFPAEDYNETETSRRYYNAMTFSVDQVIANVTNALKRNGMYENTVMVISTDNGGTYEHYHGPKSPVTGSSNFPLRGYKYSYFEGGIRGFGMIHSPLLPNWRRGTKSKILLHITDFYTTFCKLAGLNDCSDEFSDAPLDGVDAWSLLLDNKDDNVKRPASGWASHGGPGEDEVMLGVGHGISGALRKGDMKIIVGGVPRQTDGWSAQYPGLTEKRPPPTKDVSCKERPCLFNITADPSEEHDLADGNPTLVAELLNRYKELAAAMSIDDIEGRDKYKDLIWDGAYHVPRVIDAEACERMKQTGFWAPWKSHPNNPDKKIFTHEFPDDGPESRFNEETLLI